MRNLNSKKFVNTLAGEVKKEMAYAHGHASLEGTIVAFGQSFKGANPVPLFNGIGDFGSIKSGIHTKIQPRYVEIEKHKLCDLIFRRCDLPLYEYNYDESKQVEPKYMVPTIPLSVLMTKSTPGAGFLNKIWARNPFDVIDYVRKTIKRETTFTLWGRLYTPNARVNPNRDNKDLIKEYKTFKEQAKIDDIDYKGNLFRGKVKSQECEYASYKRENAKTILVSELPTGVYIDNIVKYLDEKDIEARDATKGDDMFVEIKYNQDDFDDKLFELGLAVYMDSHLNYLNHKSFVRSFDSYEEVVEAWLPFRRDIVIARIKRQIECLEVEIIRLENILRFLRANMFSLDKNSTKEDWDKALLNKGIVKIDMSILSKNIKAVKEFALNLGDPSWSYIKMIKINSLSTNKIDKFQRELDLLNKQLKAKREETWEETIFKELDEVEDCLGTVSITGSNVVVKRTRRAKK
jgi:DNA topoisomerase-2